MQDNRDTLPELILTRTRLGRNQATLNIELGLSTKQSVTSSQGGASAGTSISGGISGDGGGGFGGGGGGGGGSCFSGDTLVNMFYGLHVPINLVELRSYVEAPDENGDIRKGEVIGRSQRLYFGCLHVTFEDGRKVRVQPTHRYRNENGIYVPIAEADHSLHWVGEDWVRVKIVSKEQVREDVSEPFYNLEIKDHHAYMAAGDWVSNSKPIEEATS